MSSSAATKREQRFHAAKLRLQSFVHHNGDSWLLRQPYRYASVLIVAATDEKISHNLLVAWSRLGWIVRRLVDPRANTQSWELTEAGSEMLGAL